MDFSFTDLIVTGAAIFQQEPQPEPLEQTGKYMGARRVEKGHRCEAQCCAVPAKKNKGRSAVGLQWFVDHAASKGGKCLSTEYISSLHKLKFECAHGHQWETVAKNVRNIGSWCPECANTGRPPVGLQWFLDHAISKGGKCLSTERANQKQKLHFVCEQGHRFDMASASVYKGCWCMECALQKKRGGLAWFVDHAISKGGKCLSTEYTNQNHKLKFECKEGHQFESSGGSIRHQDAWCAVCSKRSPVPIKWFVDHALSRGGKCLSNEYINQNSKLKFECQHGHQWEAKANSVRHTGTWCPECAGKRLGLQWFVDHAISKGGKCLSTEYFHGDRKLKFECQHGHRWESSGLSIRNNGSWCPECAGVKRLDLQWFVDHAISRGGKCLSNEYINQNSKLKFECQHGHRWESNGANIRNSGSWCPSCLVKGETALRESIEMSSGWSFPKVRPAWLVGEKGSKLELDGYCEEFGFAFEYQGRQHSEFIPHFHGDEDGLMEQQARDARKAQTLIERGVFLVEIHETLKQDMTRDKTKFKESIHEALEQECQRQCLPIMSNPEFRDFMLSTQSASPLLPLL